MLSTILLTSMALLPVHNAVYAEKKTKEEAQREKAEKKAAKEAEKAAAADAERQKKQDRIDAKAARKAEAQSARADKKKGSPTSKTARNGDETPTTQPTAAIDKNARTPAAVQLPRTARQTPTTPTNTPAPGGTNSTGTRKGKLSFSETLKQLERERAEKQKQSTSGSEFNDSRELTPQ